MWIITTYYFLTTYNTVLVSSLECGLTLEGRDVQGKRHLRKEKGEESYTQGKQHAKEVLCEGCEGSIVQGM